MERNSRTRLTTAVIIALVFGSGAMVGMAWGRTLPESEPVPDTVAPQTEEQGAEEAAEEDRPRRRMIDRIDLTEAQRTAIDQVLSVHRTRMDSLNALFRQDYYPRYYGIIDETRGLLMDQLTAEQAATYQGLLKEWDKDHPRYENEELPFRRRD